MRTKIHDTHIKGSYHMPPTPFPSSSSVSALAVVVGHELSTEMDTLREENARLTSAVECLKRTAAADHEYYFNLVWVARGWEEDDRANNPSMLAIMRNMGREEQFARDVGRLSGDDGDWVHGFNSGMLAASRMYEGLANATKDRPCVHGSVFTMDQQRTLAQSEFPMLDT